MPTLAGYKFCTSNYVIAISAIHPAYRGMDDRIQNWIKQATTAITSHCNREFVKTTGIEEYFGTPDRGCSSDGPYNVYLKEPNPDLGMLTLYLSYAHQFNDDTKLTLNDDYFVERLPSNRELVRIALVRPLCYNTKSLKIVYDGGYDIDTEDTDLVLVPREVVQATALQAGFLMSRAGSEDIGTGDPRAQTARRDPRIRPEGITPEVTFNLRKWRRSLTGSM